MHVDRGSELQVTIRTEWQGVLYPRHPVNPARATLRAICQCDAVPANRPSLSEFHAR
jgi:hypothetical protein